ncbi:PrpF domain-containing protein [Dankookia sp. GCM10030260]|uniref:PrpF domain-containing protein n=1 Tax=Dankookia sp. GCM10030260 TaxID=3273390 RepID=UPI0036151106
MQARGVGLAGTLVHEVTLPRNRSAIRIGHPAGGIDTKMASDGDVTRATLDRTARRALKGRVVVAV